MPDFAVQHIDGGVILTVSRFATGYHVSVTDPRGGVILNFPTTTLDAAIAQAVDLITDDI